MNRVVAIVLIIVSLIIGYIGISKITASQDSVKFLGMKISATDETTQTQGFVYVVLAVIVFIGAIYTLRKSNRIG